MNDTPRQTPITPPSSTIWIPNDNQVNELKDVNRQAFPIVDDATFHQNLDKCGDEYLSDIKLMGQFNRRILPIMPDEKFIENVDRLRKSCKNGEFKLELQRFMDRENARIYDDFLGAKLTHGFDLICLPSDKDKQFRLMNSIRTPSDHGYQEFVTICSRLLVEMSRNLPKLSEGKSKAGSKGSSKAGSKGSSEAGSKGSSKAGSKGSSKQGSKTGPKMSRGVSKTKETRSSARIKAARIKAKLR